MNAPPLRHTIGSVSDVGRVRERNEDSCASWQDPGAAPASTRTLLVVADGLGGANAGEVASRMVVQAIVAPWTCGLAEDPMAVLRDAFAAANAAVYARANSEPELKGMGTTCTAVYIEGSSVWVGHVGDSRAYLVRDGRAQRLTHDHSLVQDLIERGELNPEDAKRDSRRNVLLRSMGMDATIAADVDRCKEELRPRDVLVLCSDGLHSEVDDSEIARVATTHDPQSTCRLLVEMANKRGGRDNCTVVALKAEAIHSFDPMALVSAHPWRVGMRRWFAWAAVALVSLALAGFLVKTILR